jgi:tRNA-dihydrouridine synthase
MAGITDAPFRIMCLKGGAGLVCAEMVSASALKYSNAKSVRMLAEDSFVHTRKCFSSHLVIDAFLHEVASKRIKIKEQLPKMGFKYLV